MKKTALSFPIYDLTGAEVSQMSLPKEIFTSKVNEKLLSLYARVYSTNQRQGNASTKTRSEINATTKKIYKQKGTGRARHGAKSAHIFVGGGVVFGPRPKTYSLSLNKKQKRKALFDSLTYALSKNKFFGLSQKADAMKPKTKLFQTFLNKIKLQDGSILFVLPKVEKNSLVLSARNIPALTIIDAKNLNAFEILKAKYILFHEGSIDVLEKHFLKKDAN